MVHLPLPAHPNLGRARTIKLEQNEHIGLDAPIISRANPPQGGIYDSGNAGAEMTHNGHGNQGLMPMTPSNGHSVPVEHPRVGEPMLRQNANINPTNRLIFDQMPYVNAPNALSQFGHGRPGIPHFPLPAAIYPGPLQSADLPADPPQLTSFYISAPFLQLPCGSIFVSGPASPESRLVQLRGHVPLNYFIGQIRHAHSITPDLRVHVLQVVVGARSFDMDLVHGARCELDWTMVLGLLLLGEEHVAHVSVGVQVNSAGVGMPVV